MSIAPPKAVSKGLINGPIYDGAYFLMKYTSVPPHLHRLRNAIGLTLGLFLGRKMMNIVVGETPEGKKIDKDLVIAPLRPLHGLLAYDHFSDDPNDRWMKVFDMFAPAILGGIGASMGSASFFKESFMKPVESKMGVAADKFFIGDAEKRALYHEAKPWSVLTGASAVPGSASGLSLAPSLGHYGGDLGTLFVMRSERTAAPLGKLVNSHSQFPYRPTKLINRLIEYAAGNPSANPELLDKYANGILKAWFKNVKPEQIEAFVGMVKNERAQFIKAGALPAEAEKQVRDRLKKMLEDAGLEKTFLKLGLDPREANIGDMGFMSIIAHSVGDMLGMGTSRKMDETRKLLRKGLEARHPELRFKPFDISAGQLAYSKEQVLAALTLGATTIGSFAALATAKDSEVSDLPKGNAAANTQEGAKETATKTSGHHVHSKKDHGFVNGRLLDTAEGITGMFNVIREDLKSHRIFCALGFTTGGWLGEKSMEAITGVSFMGNKLKKEEVFAPFRKLYKTLPFNFNGDAPKDKWMKLLRYAVPTALGAVGVIQGSKYFFAAPHKKAENATYLDEVENKATFTQAEPWTYTSALTAIFGGSSGFVWIPGINYATSLGTRYSMASARKVSMPGLGKLWSNNSTLFPFGPTGMIDLLVKEAVNNKARDPELLETYAIGVLKPWFENVTAEQVESFVNRIHEIRDRYYKEGGVPEDCKPKLEKELHDHLKGAGLERTLNAIGLDPERAHIANNGLSGTISNILGAGSKVQAIEKNYKQSYRERIAHEQQGEILPSRA